MAEPKLATCAAPTREELRAIRVARAEALKRALDADAAPAVLSGAWTVLLFCEANKVPEADCSGAPTTGVCRG